MMNSINYFRVLLTAKCNNCGWTGHDIDCEEYSITETKPGHMVAEIINKCPQCENHILDIEKWPEPVIEVLHD